MSNDMDQEQKEVSGLTLFHSDRRMPRSRTVSQGSSSKDRVELTVLSLLNADKPEEEEELIVESPSGQNDPESPDLPRSQFGTPVAKPPSVRKARLLSRRQSHEPDLPEECFIPRPDATKENQNGCAGDEETENCPFLRPSSGCSSTSSHYTSPAPSRNAVIFTPLPESNEQAKECPKSKSESSTSNVRISRLDASPETAIQVDTSPVSSSNGSSTHAKDRDSECSTGALCGPKPWRISLLIFVVLAIWASIVMGIHVHKKVSGMERELSQAHSKLVDLQSRFVQFKEESVADIVRLEELIVEAMARRPSNKSENDLRRPRTPTPTRPPKQAVDRSKKPGQKERAPKSSSRRRSSTTIRPNRCTEDGTPCVFPFKYGGQVRRECIKTWYNPAGKHWCATQVDADGNYIKGDEGVTWGVCSKSIC